MEHADGVGKRRFVLEQPALHEVRRIRHGRTDEHGVDD
jgi:hypothetical protein